MDLTCKSTEPTVNGNKYGSIRDNILSTLKQARSCKSKKMLRLHKSVSAIKLRDLIRNGELSMLIPRKIKLRELTSTSDSKSTSHSSSFQECQ